MDEGLLDQEINFLAGDRVGARYQLKNLPFAEELRQTVQQVVNQV